MQVNISGSGTQTLSASNTYTGTTQVSAGTLTVSGSGRLSDSTAVTVDSGAVYNVAVVIRSPRLQELVVLPW